MPNVNDLLGRMARTKGMGFEMELGDEHLNKSVLPSELRVFEKKFKFTPVNHDPFPKPEPKAKKS